MIGTLNDKRRCMHWCKCAGVYRDRPPVPQQYSLMWTLDAYVDDWFNQQQKKKENRDVSTDKV